MIVTVAALTVLWKSTPPDCVTNTVPSGAVPTAPVTVTRPVVLIVRFSAAPVAALPVIVLAFTIVAPPVPSVRLLPSASVVAPSVIVPVPAFSVALSVTETAVVPRFIATLVVLIAPAMLFGPAVATNPPVNVVVSPAASPISVVPVLANVEAPPIVFVVPVSDTFCVVPETLIALTVTLLLKTIELPFAPPSVSVCAEPSLTAPENVAVPLLTAVSVAALLRVTLPEKVELWAVLPPIESVLPLLPACTVMFRPTVNAPPVSSAALAVPLVSPSKTAFDELPNAPADPDGALAPTTNVPSLIVVSPV